MNLHECYLCGETQNIFYCYPVAGLDRVTGIMLCARHQEMRQSEPLEFYKLLQDKLKKQKGKK